MSISLKGVNDKLNALASNVDLLEQRPIGSDVWTKSGANVYVVDEKVGIGMDSPLTTLQVATNSRIDGSVRVMTTNTDVVGVWNSQKSAVDNEWSQVCWSAELGIFVAISGSGTGNRVMTSPDGANWIARATPIDNYWRAICWSPELRLFVAVAFSGPGNRVMTSPDGITWTLRVAAVNNEWCGVCWSPELRLFVAVSVSGSNNRAMTSPDGIIWTARSTPTNNFQSVCWSPELGLFVAVADTGNNDRVMTSPNGITWTTRTVAANSWLSVCWSPDLRLFVAVAYSGTGDRVATSSDGVTWTSRVSATDSFWWSVCWSPQLRLFVAVGGTQVMTSVNGITWISQSGTVQNDWRSVCWSPEQGLFVVVGSSGVGTRVMTYRGFGIGGNIVVSNKIGLGVSSPTYQLQLSTDSSAKPTTSTWTVVSDERLKTDIEVADYVRCNDIVKQVDLKRFTWNVAEVPELEGAQIKDSSQLGWIAQDVAKVFPKSTHIVEEQYGLSNVMNVNFDQMYAVLFGAIKHLQGEIERRINQGLPLTK